MLVLETSITIVGDGCVLYPWSHLGKCIVLVCGARAIHTGNEFAYFYIIGIYLYLSFFVLEYHSSYECAQRVNLCTTQRDMTQRGVGVDMYMVVVNSNVFDFYFSSECMRFDNVG
jgi:hypothetical protein